MKEIHDRILAEMLQNYNKYKIWTCSVKVEEIAERSCIFATMLILIFTVYLVPRVYDLVNESKIRRCHLLLA